MRPDIEAGPIGRKWRPSNGPPPAMEAVGLDDCDCAIRRLSARGLNAAPSAARRMRTRTVFMADSGGWSSHRRLADFPAPACLAGGRERLAARSWRLGVVWNP